MNEKSKEELIYLGLSAVKDALCYIGNIEDCKKSDALFNILSSAVVFGESIINGNKK